MIIPNFRFSLPSRKGNVDALGKNPTMIGAKCSIIDSLGEFCEFASLPICRAVIDFERRDDDELGFRKNDIITIISERDEHCWVGELNGHQGWFPAKLVEPLDERTKQYSFAGDDSVSASVTDLVCNTQLARCVFLGTVLDYCLILMPVRVSRNVEETHFTHLIPL